MANLSNSNLLMSQGNMLLGQARGKVGDVVFYVRNGVQQTRPRNRKPANPQTINQMNQRVKMAAPVGFYKRNSPFFKMAFRKSERESFYNAFIRLNINIGPYLTREMVVDGYKAPAPYIVADGTMPSIAITDSVTAGDTGLSLTTTIPSSLITWGDFRRHYNLVYGDMLTLVTFDSQSNRESLVTRAIVQHVFDVASDNLPIGYDMSGTTWGVNGSVKYVTMDSEYWQIPQWNLSGSAIILSRNSGAVNCSYAQLKLNEQAQFTYDELRTDAARQIAVASYAEINDAVLDPINAEGNEAEFVQLYKDTSHTQPINELTMYEGDGEDAFLPEYLRGRWTSVEAINLTSDISVASFNAVTEYNGLFIEGGTVGVARYLLNIKNSSGGIVAKTIITITINVAP